MDKDMVLEIFVSFSDKNGNKAQGNIATGYPIAKNRILTARHSLFSDDGNTPGEIEVQWYFKKTQSDYKWKKAKIVDCEFDPELDIAVLECEFPKEHNAYCKLESENPGKEFSWESIGFAQVGQKQDERIPTDLSGESYSAADNAEYLVLAEKAKVSDAELWAGVSGSPIFFKNSNTIIGVTVKCPAGHDAGRLHAVPSWKFSKHLGFCKATGLDSGAQRIEEIRQELVQQLQKSTAVFASVKDYLEKTHQIIFEKMSESEIVNAVATNIISLHILKLLEMFNSILDDFIKQKSFAKARSTKQLFYYLLPIVFDQRVIESISSKSAFGLCTVPIATTTVAEIVMAGVDRRSVEYVFQDDPHKELCGKNNIENQIKYSPNLGICDDSKYVEAVTGHLIGAYSGISDLIKKKTMGKERLVKRAAGELRRLSKHNSQTLYCIYELPGNTEEKNKYICMLKELEKSFPSLVLMNISSAEADEDEEFDTYYLLRKIHTTKIESE